jgi:cation transport ATPase
MMSGVAATVILMWIGYHILRQALMAVTRRAISTNMLLSTGAGVRVCVRE